MTSTQVPKNTVERRVWIKSQLELHGASYATIARELGVSRQAVRAALSGRSRRAAEAIAAKLGLAPADIWPERYSERAHHSPRKRRVQ